MNAYFTVEIPWVEPARRTAWHPTVSTGPLSTLTRGAFDTPELAHEWARKHLDGNPYTLQYVPGISHVRRYQAGEPVEPGDVVRMAGDGGAFATCIVRHVDIAVGSVELERPHAFLSGRIGCVKGGVASMNERFSVPIGRFLQEFEVYVTGASNTKDNRSH